MATGKSKSRSLCVRVGEKVREVRLAHGWSQRMLADHAGIEQAHLARLETGQVEPGILLLEKIAEALEIEIVTLFTF
jgi:transcriptional regulator with XRE-family HTH domain